MERYKKKFKESDSDHRITYGASEIYEIKNESDKEFAKKFINTGKDVFFFKDENIASVIDRTTSLIYNGKKGDFKLLNDLKYVYASYEDSFYTSTDFAKLIRGIYHGVRSRVKPIII